MPWAYEPLPTRRRPRLRRLHLKTWSMSSIRRDVKKKVLPRPEARFLFSRASPHGGRHRVPEIGAAAQPQINSTSRFESFALRCITVYSGSGILPSDTASQISMRSSVEWG